MPQVEFRYILPLSIEEYQVAEAWGVAQEYTQSDDDEGIHLIERRPFKNEFGKGTYYHCLYRYPSLVPNLLKSIMKKFSNKSLDMHEESWVDFPRTRSIYWNHDFLKDVLSFTVDTVVLPDLGTTENVHNLPENQWKKVQVKIMDIAQKNPSSAEGFAGSFNPLTFESKKSSRVPIKPDWITNITNGVDGAPSHCVCAYKLVSCEFKYRGLQKLVQDALIKYDGATMLAFNQKIFCCMDEWLDLTPEDVQKMLEEKLSCFQR